MKSRLIEFLPGYNCGKCNYKNCESFASALISNDTSLSKCTPLCQEKYKTNKEHIQNILSNISLDSCIKEKFVGVIDNYEADIALKPLKGESSCREVLQTFTDQLLKIGDIVRYRPLGCPVVHFGKIIKANSALITVHIVGPCDRLSQFNNSIDIDCCMVVSFEGRYYGKDIKIGETVRFLPKHCMMQKIHSGVVVNIEDDKILIEGIDLKVWTPPLQS